MGSVKKIICAVIMILLPLTVSSASVLWEKEGAFYYLKKDTRENFSAEAAGANKFTNKYLAYNGVDFLVRGADSWKDYGRLDLEENNLFSLPLRSGMKVEEVHLLSGGNVGNSYKHDDLLRLYGDNYFYAVITVIFAYQDNTYKSLSVPVFWDWFHLGPGVWSKNGAKIKSLGNNPVRKDCSMFHLSFINPRPADPVKAVLISDSWVRDYPFSEIFAVTIRSTDLLEAESKKDQKFPVAVSNAAQEPADNRMQWSFDAGLDGWIPGCSSNWDSDSFWQADFSARKGVVIIPACNWAGDKFSWIEKKVALPAWEKIKLEFLRSSAVYSEFARQWSDGLLKVIVKSAAGQETVYEKLYSGEWSVESMDLSLYKGKTVILRLENHGAGQVRLGQSTSAVCDAEDAIIDDIRLSR